LHQSTVGADEDETLQPSKSSVAVHGPLTTTPTQRTKPTSQPFPQREPVSMCGEPVSMCAICLDKPKPNDTFVSHCKHIFCNKCILEWIARHDDCPLCRGQ
jgi:hypothetical protein